MISAYDKIMGLMGIPYRNDFYDTLYIQRRALRRARRIVQAERDRHIRANGLTSHMSRSDKFVIAMNNRFNEITGQIDTINVLL